MCQWYVVALTTSREGNGVEGGKEDTGVGMRDLLQASSRLSNLFRQHQHGSHRPLLGHPAGARGRCGHRRLFQNCPN